MNAPAHPSLSRRLLLGLAGISFGYWIVIAGLTVRDSVGEVNELFDVHLAQTALALLRVTDPDENDPASIPASAGAAPPLSDLFGNWPELPERLARMHPAGPSSTAAVPGSIHSMHQAYERNLRYQVWTRGGRLLLRSANAPTGVMSERDGYSESADAEGRVWRHFGIWDQHGDFRILVSEAHEIRNRIVRGIALQTTGPLAFSLPVLALLLWLSVRRGLDPLGRLRRQLQARRPDNLAPLDAASAPREVRPLVQALNDLLRRVSDALDGERRFTANAAHELRTPLAAIQAHLHGARSASSESERQRALDQLQRGVERGIRVVGQMLALARLDPEQTLPDAAPVCLCELAEAVCAELAPLALQRDQRLALQSDRQAAPVLGHADMLAVLLSNLVDNALRYTPRGGSIDVAVRASGSAVVLEVADSGPGIAPAQRVRVFDRFFRTADAEAEGTGLGLAICRRVVELHQACIELGEGAGGHGLVVRVVLGPAAA